MKNRMIKPMAALLLAGSLALAPVTAFATDMGTKLEDSVAYESAETAIIEMEDGEYAISVTLEGGSGKATVTSPTVLIVEDGYAYAELEWSSTHYDYMIVGGEKYLRTNEDGNSKFTIPITNLTSDGMVVIADTTAMSVPHEVEYKLYFDSDSVTSKSATPQAAAKREVAVVVGIIAVCIVVSQINKKRKQR